MIALPLLLLALSAEPAAPDNLIRVWCSEPCNVKIDGQVGKKLNKRHHQFQGIAPGSRRVEAKAWAGTPLKTDYVAIPATGTLDIRIDEHRMVASVPKPEGEPKVEAKADAPAEAQAPKLAGAEGAPLPADPKPMKVAVLKLAARAGLEAPVVDLFGDSLVGELRKHKGVRVISSADVAAAIGFEKDKKLLGCTDASCLAEIGGALGVDRIVHGSVGRLGSSLVVNLTLADPVRGTAISAVSERLKSANDEAFLDALPGMVDKLLDPPAPSR